MPNNASRTNMGGPQGAINDLIHDVSGIKWLIPAMHVFMSAFSVYPYLQLHLEERSVFVQFWLQPPLLSAQKSLTANQIQFLKISTNQAENIAKLLH